jgi:ATP-dependent Clp protease ATP-binding subunit ClpA
MSGQVAGIHGMSGSERPRRVTPVDTKRRSERNLSPERTAQGRSGIRDRTMQATIAFADTLQRARDEAARRGHGQVTCEHLLLALTDDPDVYILLKGCGVDIGDLKERAGSWLEGIEAPEIDGTPTMSAGTRRVLKQAEATATAAGASGVDGRLALISLFSERDSEASRLLHALDITRYSVVMALPGG